ncbi:hypothetical protein VPH35_053785 [Triticum aestivum]
MTIRPHPGAHTATPDLTPDHTADEKTSAAPAILYHCGSSSADGDGDAPSAWSSSLGNLETMELCRADGYLPLGPGATAEELRTHIGGHHNIVGRHNFWRAKVFDDVIAAFRVAEAGVTPDPTGASVCLCAPALAHGPAWRERRRGSVHCRCQNRQISGRGPKLCV